ncbi:MAG: hypothetical protein H7Y09_10885 [Chitinophagaceae bacterium]|nr:hypothetical protein [Anaerolineae bacterium]
MGRSPIVGFIIALGTLAACAPANVPAPVSTVQIAQGDSSSVVATIGVSVAATAPANITPESFQGPQPTSEINSPLQVATVAADFVLVTPTLPPSKTLTQTLTPTLTQTLTPTITITPTITVTATATLQQFPTAAVTVIAIPAVVAQPQAVVCDTAWFFSISPAPTACPIRAESTSAGVYLTFQNATMIWVGQEDAIYIFYNDGAFPLWQAFRDPFDQGMVEDDPAYANAPFPNTWQPRRGFGLLWRTNAEVRNRVGWATLQFEQSFSVQAQTAKDGTFFVTDPSGGVYAAFFNRVGWQRYTQVIGSGN